MFFIKNSKIKWILFLKFKKILIKFFIIINLMFLVARNRPNPNTPWNGSCVCAMPTWPALSFAEEKVGKNLIFNYFFYFLKKYFFKFIFQRALQIHGPLAGIPRWPQDAQPKPGRDRDGHVQLFDSGKGWEAQWRGWAVCEDFGGFHFLFYYLNLISLKILIYFLIFN